MSTDCLSPCQPIVCVHCHPVISDHRNANLVKKHAALLGSRKTIPSPNSVLCHPVVEDVRERITIELAIESESCVRGNLQYNTSESTYKWRFAENQYDVIGTWNTSTWVDLFGWGTWTGSNPSKVTNISTTGSQYSFDDADFSQESILADATQRSYDWRTLSKDEWVYVFNTRTVNGGTGAGKSYTLDATVGSREGVVLYPDNYTGAVYSGSNWASFEAAGCVFLPGAGYRSEGTSMHAAGSRGRYWSSTPYNSFAYYVRFDSSDLYPQQYDNHYSGYSVRLVRPVE